MKHSKLELLVKRNSCFRIILLLLFIFYSREKRYPFTRYSAVYLWYTINTLLRFSKKKLEVNFVHDCEKLRDKECNYKPTASTCALSLNLPIHIKSIPEMTKSMTEAVRWSYGFGKV